MARIRTLKPEWPNSRDLRRLSAGGVTIWWILVSQADDEGRLHADADDVARQARPWVEPEEVAEQLDRMARQKMIGRYSVSGEPYLQLLNWPRHQRVDHPTPSNLPPPPKSMLARVMRAGAAHVIRAGDVRVTPAGNAAEMDPDRTQIPRESLARRSRDARESPRAGPRTGPDLTGSNRKGPDRIADHARRSAREGPEKKTLATTGFPKVTAAVLIQLEAYVREGRESMVPAKYHELLPEIRSRVNGQQP